MKNDKKVQWRMRLSAITCLTILSMFFSGMAQNTWKAARGMPQKAGKDVVKIKRNTTKKNELQFEYALPKVITHKSEGLSVNGLSEERLELGNAPLKVRAGEPVLPVLSAQIILPPGTTIDDVKLKVGSIVPVAGTHQVEHGQKPIALTPGAERSVIKRDERIYSSDNTFPSKQVEVVGVYTKRGVRIAVININPVIYHPKSGQLSTYETLSLDITTKPDTVKQLRPRLSKGSSTRLFMSVENPEDTASYSTFEGSMGSSVSPQVVNPAQSFRYVIITSSTMRDAVADYTLRDLVARKQAQGISATIVTVDSIYSQYTGIDNPQKIRNFIIDAYTNWETDYVLLAGDDNIIPVRYLYDDGTTIPSDLYYQCLDGNFNSDGDSNWGEPNDGTGGIDVDLMAEVAVGRASAETPLEMSNFVYKTIAYNSEIESTPYLRRATMVGEYLGSQFGSGIYGYAYPEMKEIHYGSIASGYTTTGFNASASFSVDSLDDYFGTWSASQLITRFNSNATSIYNHLGHANETNVMKLTNSDVDALTNTKPFFIYSQGCYPGDFTTDCIAEHFTTTHRYGAFAVVFNSRYGYGAFNDADATLDGPSQRFDRQFWDAYFSEYILTYGDANADSHEDNIWDIGGEYIRWCMYETNLFGDPQLYIRGQVLGPMVQYVSHVTNDVAGNNDGIINPGEQISVLPTITNVGSDSAHNVNLEIATTDQYLSIVDNTAAVGNLSCCGSSRQALDNFIIQVAANCPTPRTVSLTMTARDNAAGVWTSTIPITVYTSSQLSGYVRTITGANPISGATVSFSGPISGSVRTNNQGAYMFGGINGTYSVTAIASGYTQSASQSITFPPSAGNVNFALGRPMITVTPASINRAVLIGDSTQVPFSVLNSGDMPLVVSVSTNASNMGLWASASKYYDATHFVAIDKGANDNRLGDPQQLTRGGPDTFGYRWIDSREPGGPAYAWTDISSTGTILSTISGCDDCYEQLSLSFPFKFYGTNFTSCYVGSNGYLTFGSYSTQFSNYPLPSTSMPANLIAGFFDDLYPITAGDVYFQDLGDRAIVQFNSVSIGSSDTYTCTFQIVLRRNGAIDLYYKSITGSQTGCTVGIQNATQTTGLGVVYNAAYLTDSLAVEFRTTPPWLSAGPERDTIEPGTTGMFNVRFASAGLNGGRYTGSVMLSHNAPGSASPFLVPCTLNVDGMRRLAVSPQTINFGTHWVGSSDTAILTLTNRGDEGTLVSSVSCENTNFRCISELPITVPLAGSAELRVVYQPSVVGVHNASISIQSNAEDNPSLSISVSGTGTNPPIASVNPDSLHFSLSPSDPARSLTSTLRNTGNDTLIYQIVGVNETGNPNTATSIAVMEKSKVMIDQIYSTENYMNPYYSGRIIVGMVEGSTAIPLALLNRIGAKGARELAIARNPKTGLAMTPSRKPFLITLNDTSSEAVIKAVSLIRDDPAVAYAEPDYEFKATTVPNDPYFSQLYGMQNIGQSGGTVDADIDATDVWERHTGNKTILLGIIDTGIDYLHPDLAANIWTNPGEIPGNSIDDDHNGFIDDIHGWDFAYDDSNPMDGHYHGTHCAGTIGGVGNNGIGVAGVMWNANIVAIKFLDDGGSGSSSDAIDAVNYATAMGIKITSNSWGGGAFSQALMDAIATGGLFVAAAGNSGTDNDASPHYPSSYDLNNVLAVAATDRNDQIASFSCYGRTSVDLGAPGVDIYSCAPSSSYQLLSGTSMATPHVSGSAGLIWSNNPMLTAVEVKRILMESVDQVSSLSGRTVTGGRLNVAKALVAAGPTWLSASPLTQGRVLPGGSAILTVTVNPAGLEAGLWRGQVLVATNDPVHQQIPIRVGADIKASRNLSVSTNSISFRPQWIRNTDTAMVRLINRGNAPTRISALSFSNPIFLCPTTVPFSVPAFDSVNIRLLFSPTSTGNFSGTLTITSDAQDNPAIAISMTGVGIQGPQIQYNPQFFHETLFVGDSSARRLKIKNTGGDTLRLSITPQTTVASINSIDNTVVEKLRASQITFSNLKTTDTIANRVENFKFTQEKVLNPFAKSVLLVQDQLPWGNDVIQPLLTAMGVSVTTITSSQIEAQNLSQFNVIIFPSAQSSSYYTNYRTNKAKIDAYVQSGGIIEVHCATMGDTFSLPGNTKVNYQTSPTNYVINRSHSITSGVDSVLTGSSASHAYFSNLQANANLLIRNADGQPTLITYTYGYGCVVATGMTWEFYYPSGLGNPLMPNALQYSVNGANTNQWLSVHPTDIAISAGDSADIAISFNAMRLIAGDHVGGLLLQHNAPGTISPIAIPCTLTVNGYRRLSVSPAVVNFRQTRVGQHDTSFITLSNSGNEAVQVAAFNFSNPGFASPSVSPFTLQAYDSIRIPLIFTPLSSVNYSGTLTVTSNAQDNPSLSLPLSGEGIIGPSITVTPPQISLRLATDRNAVRTVSVRNTGDVDLSWSLVNGSGSGMVSRETHDTISGIQSRTYVATHDLSCDYWSDAGNDAFDGFGNPSVTVGGVSSQICMMAGDSSYTINGYRIRVRNDFAENHIYRSIIEPAQGSATRSDITVNLTGDMGSDGSETVYPDSVLVNGTWLRFYVNEYSFPNSDPRVVFLIVPSNTAQRDSVRYWRPSSGYVSMEARNISLPATVYVIPSYHSLSSLKQWFQNDLISRSTWLSVTPNSGVTTPGQVSDLQFSFVTTGMQEGTYYDTIRIMHNGFPVAPINIPIELTVNNSSVSGISRILTIGSSASLKMQGNRYSLQNITIGSPVSGTVRSSRYRLVFR